MSEKYELKAEFFQGPQPTDPKGIKLSWTYPASMVFHDHDIKLYIQRSTTKTNWPLQPNFSKRVGVTDAPTPEAGWTTIKEFDFSGGGEPYDYIEYGMVPNPNLYYRIIAFWYPNDSEGHTEYDWATATVTLTVLNAALWGVGIGSNGGDVAYCIDIDSSGNSYVGGNYDTLKDPPYFSGGVPYPTISKVDSNGNVVWTRSLGFDYTYGYANPIDGTNGIQGNIVNGIVVDRVGAPSAYGPNLFVIGTFSGSLNLGNGTGIMTSVGYSNIFIAKLEQTATGYKCLWRLQLGGGSGSYVSPTDLGKAIAQNSVGDLICLGTYGGTLAVNTTAQGNIVLTSQAQDILLLKVTTAGVITYAYGFGTDAASGDVPYGVALDAADKIYICGYFGLLNKVIDFGNGKTLTSTAVITDFTACFNSAGVCQWAVKSGTSDLVVSRMTTICVDAYGNVWNAGLIEGIFTINKLNAATGASLLNNPIQFVQHSNGPDGITSIKKLTNGKVIVCGHWGSDYVTVEGNRIANPFNPLPCGFLATLLADGKVDSFLRVDQDPTNLGIINLNALTSDTNNHPIVAGVFSRYVVIPPTLKLVNKTVNGLQGLNDYFVIKLN